MKEVNKDILQHPALKENPFTVPPGYFSSLEEQVHAKIRGRQGREVSPDISSEGILPVGISPEKTSRLAIFKTHFALVATFALIFGIGYGFFHLTGSAGLKMNALSSNESAYIQDSLLRENLLKEVLRNAPLDESELLETIEVITPELNVESIEQYLIDSNVPLVSLASLE